MPYYHNLITEKSWQALLKLKKEVDFVLIGGWAVWLYAKTLKSKDIDIIADYEQLEKIREKYDLFKNNRLKKYEIKLNNISVDIYVSFYSDLGIPAEEIIKHAKSFKGFKIPSKEILLILKQKAYANRKLSIKGKKDSIDIFSLILLPDFNWQLYKKILERYGLIGFAIELKKLIKETIEIKELNLNRHKFSRAKKGLLENL